VIERVVIVGCGRTGRALAAALAPRHQVVVVDPRAEALEGMGAPRTLDAGNPLGPAEQPGLIAVQADGTSRLVLRALLEAHAACALVATAGSDEVNLEACRLGRELGFTPLLALQRTPERAEDYRQERVTALDRTGLMAEHMQRSLKQRGAVVPVGIGLGRGELVEIRLQRTSPLVGRTLRELAPHRWRVAAIFRGEAVLVPQGETRLQADDRVLLVGAPEVLTGLVEHLRLGQPQFPRPFGPNVVSLEPGGADEVIYREAGGLACATATAAFVRGTPGGAEHPPFAEDDLEAAPPCAGQAERLTFDLQQADAPGYPAAILRQRPGVLVVRPGPRRPWWARLLGRPGQDGLACDALPRPFLFARGTFPYRRILLPVSGSPLDRHAAEVAIDLSRQLGAALSAVHVDLPQFVSGQDPDAAHGEVVPIRRLCELYDVRLDYRHRVGNPIRGLVEESARHELVVLARRHRRRDTLTDPDVALELARRVACSALVVTVRPED